MKMATCCLFVPHQLRYPHALFFLELLQSPDFRKEIARSTVTVRRCAWVLIVSACHPSRWFANESTFAWIQSNVNVAGNSLTRCGHVTKPWVSSPLDVTMIQSRDKQRPSCCWWTWKKAQAGLFLQYQQGACSKWGWVSQIRWSYFWKEGSHSGCFDTSLEIWANCYVWQTKPLKWSQG